MYVSMYTEIMMYQFGCLSVSCNVLTTFDIEFIISSLLEKRAFISFFKSSKLALKSLKHLLWNSMLFAIMYIRWIFVESLVSYQCVFEATGFLGFVHLFLILIAISIRIMIRLSYPCFLFHFGFLIISISQDLHLVLI